MGSAEINAQRANKQFMEAQKLHSSGDVLGALRIYELIREDLKGSTLFTFWSLALMQLGREGEAKARALDALELLPSKGALNDRVVLSTVLRRLGLLQEAERILREALEVEPKNGSARNNLALVLQQANKYDEADQLFEQAQKELLEDAAPSLNRMRIALSRRDFDRAEAMLKAARDIQPGHTDISLLEARLALMEADHERAATAIFKTLYRQPLHSEALNVLSIIDISAVSSEKLDRLLAAIVRSKPTSAKMLGMIVGMARKHLAWKHLDQLEGLLNSALENNQDALIEVGAMFLLLSANVTQKAHRIASHNGFEAFIARGRHSARPKPVPLAGRKLRVGYVSSDLRGHAIGFLSVGLFEAHRHDQIEYIAYSNWKDDGSEVRRRMRKAFDKFINITDLSDEDLAARMREDGIDVLVDLNQMTAGNRLGVFPYGPAPVTVQWLGMPGTVGAGDRIDYILLDPWTGYPGNLDGFDEKPVILAGSYQPNDWEKPDLSIGKTRSDWGLPEEAPVFCSFNQTQKFSPDTIALWARILSDLPDAVLWVLAGEPEIEARFVGIFKEAGISKERINFAPRASHADHIARLQHADVMLDNWPYNAHTTCSDALRAGTPVLTLPGRTFASRVAAGILETAGLEDWIASSPDDYVKKAVEWGRLSYSDREAKKKEIYDRYWSSPMVDCSGFAHRLENFYLEAFNRALSEKKPEPMWVAWDGAVHEGLPDQNQWRETILANRPDGRSFIQISDRLDAKITENATPSNAALSSTPWTERISKDGGFARINNAGILLNEILKVSHPFLVLDAGSLETTHTDHVWEKLASNGFVNLIGFDPQMSQTKPQKYKHLDVGLGDGETHKFYECSSNEMSSLFEPDTSWLERFKQFSQWAKVETERDIVTSRLDDLEEARGVRFLKIDTQGSEQLILANSTKLLAQDLVMIEVELSPVPLYKGEKSLFEVGEWLRQNGWILHAITNIDRRMFLPYGEDFHAFLGLKQVFQVDAVFMPHPDRWKDFSAERLKALAFLAHAIYRSHDVAALALQTLDEVHGEDILPVYKRYLKLASVDA